MYEDMQVKVEHVIDKGEVSDEYIADDQQRQAFKKWTKSFTRMDHPHCHSGLFTQLLLLWIGLFYFYLIYR